jgi:hypothetical protein
MEKQFACSCNPAVVTSGEAQLMIRARKTGLLMPPRTMQQVKMTPLTQTALVRALVPKTALTQTTVTVPWASSKPWTAKMTAPLLALHQCHGAAPHEQQG